MIDVKTNGNDIFYEAHPGESLIHHLRLTGDLASRYGKEFGCEQLACQLGLLHDVGKHTQKFQKVLHHELGRIDHAIVAAEIYNDELLGNGKGQYIYNESIHIILLRILAGHHSCFSGLYDADNYDTYIEKDYYLLPEDFSERNITSDNGKEHAVSSQNEFDDICKFIQENKLIIPIDQKEYSRFPEMDNAAKMLFARMLFSCLVDADYTASANVSKEIEDFGTSNCIIDKDQFLNALHEFRCGFAHDNQKEGMNVLRNIVYQNATEMGRELPVGIYTMTAPTGTGKTLALIKFALEQAKKNGQNRIFVVLPFLSIISQNVKTYQKIFGDSLVLEDDSIVENDDETREYAEKWDMPIIVTTSVRFFQTLFAAEAPALRKLHQITNSVVVFDESQTLPYDLTSVTMRTLSALPLYYGTTVLLSTATQPNYKVRKGLKWEATDVIKNPDELYKEYDKIKNTEIVFDINKEYTFDDLAGHFQSNEQVLYICNTTKKARLLYESVTERIGEENVFLLSSRLCTQHKEEVIDTVRKRLMAGIKCHLISTQGIEAGVDIDFPIGCREYSPFTSITQAAGRINRNGKGKGRMLVFRMKGDTKYDFPDQTYQNEANISYSMACKNEGSININELKNIEYYFQCLYGGYAGEDKESIRICEVEEDILKMSQEYRLIEDKGQYTIIVPHDRKTFENLMKEIIGSGYRVKKSDMKEYQKISVKIIGNGKVYEFLKLHCHQLKVRTKYGDSYIPWFVADKDSIYDGKTGLRTEEIIGGVFS